ncbi:MAG: class II aldolase [Nitrospirae bacterium]|nr:class II aldolase [Nitrospirota bacterium]
MNNDIEKFVKMSRYAGERFDIVQASGGNSSVKLNGGRMLIKASGFLLSDVQHDKGYAAVDNKKILEILKDSKLTRLNRKDRDRLVSKHLAESVLEFGNKPSIETFLHALLKKYTLHIHPVSVSVITCQKDWKGILKTLFGDVVTVDYRTPGIELAYQLSHELKNFKGKHGALPGVVFLQNHGLIISSDSFDEVETLTEGVLEKIEGYLGMDMSRYKLTTKVSRLINSIKGGLLIAYLSEDIVINNILKKNRELFFVTPFCPDKMVFCGTTVLELSHPDDYDSVKNYMEKYCELPCVVVYRDHLFFISRNLKKAKEMEDVFKMHILVLSATKGEVVCLSGEELRYLGNWEAEKYRQGI